jgi:hypothetical protein
MHELFQRNGYDRIVCSTEGPMGLAALYLKNAFHVQASFYMHTDWVMFGRKVLNLVRPGINRLRRISRAYYRLFDRVFVLNSDQMKWLTGIGMNLPGENVFLSSHWANDGFVATESKRESLFNLQNVKTD